MMRWNVTVIFDLAKVKALCDVKLHKCNLQHYKNYLANSFPNVYNYISKIDSRVELLLF